jgi:DNA-binding winged helix-turn-helix (wHTH) protein/Tol biopolymer transport system component
MNGRYLLRFARFELDPHEGWLRRVRVGADDQLREDGAGDPELQERAGVDGEIPLQPMVFQALVLFLDHPGTLLTKDALLSHLWPDVEVEEGSLSQVIHKLRRALGDDAEARRLVQTVPKRGFRFTAAVERVALEDPPSNLLVLPATTAGQAVRPSFGAGRDRDAATPGDGAPDPGRNEHDDPARLAPDLAMAESGPSRDRLPRENLTAPIGSESDVAEVDTVQRQRSVGRLVAGIAALVGVVILMTLLVTVGQEPPTHAPDAREEVIKSNRLDGMAGTDIQPVSDFPLLYGGPHPLRRLTRFPERVQDAALSPDGTWFAFSSTRGSGGPYSIWAQRLDGGDAIRLTRPDGEDTHPRVFGDGRRVAFTRCSSTNPHALGCGVWQAAAFGGDEHLLVPGCYLGDVIADTNALVCMRPGKPSGLDLLKVDVDTRAETVLLHWEGPMDSIAVSPDGNGIAFLSGGTPWHFHVGTDAPARVLEDGPEAITLAFGPDGRHLLCDLSLGGRRNIWAVPLDGGPRVPLTAGAGTAVYPFAARDGRSLLFTQEHREYLMFRVPSEGGPPVRIDSPTYWMSFSIDAAGRFMAYWDGDGVEDNEIGVMDVMQGTMRGFGRGAVPAISADGRFLVRVLRGDLILTDIATLAEKTLVAGGVRAVRPAFSPDGRHIAYIGTTPLRGLHRVELASGAVETVAAGRFSAPAFSPDGMWIAAGGDRGGEDSSGTHIIALRSNDSPAENGPVFVAGVRSYEAAPIWARDSASISILTQERSFSPTLVTASRDGSIHDARGTLLPLTEEPANWGVFDVQVAADGTMFYLLQRVHGDIYRVELSPR